MMLKKQELKKKNTDDSMLMSQSCMVQESLNDTPTAPLAESSIIEHVEKDNSTNAKLNEEGRKDAFVEKEAEGEVLEDILNKSDSNMNITEDSDPDKETDEDDINIQDDSFRLVLEETQDKEDTIVVEETMVPKIPSRKRKLEVLKITFTLEGLCMNDIKGLSTRKKKCTRMRRFNINLKPNK